MAFAKQGVLPLSCLLMDTSCLLYCSLAKAAAGMNFTNPGLKPWVKKRTQLIGFSQSAISHAKPRSRKGLVEYSL